jgi:hypothetical protein
MPLTTVKELIGAINEVIPDIRNKSRLHYVKTLKERKIGPGTPTWLFRNPNLGLSPLTSELQNSPVLDQGTYRQLDAGAIITRHMKRFSKKELQELLSPDGVFRIPAKQHIANELIDSTKRIYETQEFIAFQAFVLGSLSYVLNDAISRVAVSLNFPVKTWSYDDTEIDLEGVAWDTAATAKIVSDMDALLKNYKDRCGRKPERLRMTTEVWEFIKNNDEVKAVFSSYLRTSGAKKQDIDRGVITPGFVVKALDWPDIELYDERTFISYPCTNSETEGADTVVELTGGTWGLSVGDKMLCNYAVNTSGYDDWDFEATITAISNGASITITIPTGASLSAGDTLATWKTFMPQNYVQFVLDEKEN